MTRPYYDPNSPHDVSAYLQLTADLYSRGVEGISLATRSMEELARTQNGRKLLHNCHKVVSAQITAVTDPIEFAAMQWMQKIFGMLGRGGM